MSELETKPFDTADHLDNPKVIAYYLVEAFQTYDSKLILRAIGNVVRAIWRRSKPRWQL
jgi:DNA-binding phage protein